MMPKRKKKTLIIGIIVAIIVIILLVLGYLYLTTDMFKSNRTLFGKYMLNAVESIESLREDSVGESQKKLFENNKYTSEGKLKAKYVTKIGTTDESTSNVINNLEIDVKGKTDKANNLDYKEISLLKNTENIWKIELLDIGNKNAIKFSDLFNQYIMADNDVKEINLGATTSNVFNSEFGEILKFSDEDITKINDTYINTFTGDYKEEKFSKSKNEMVTVNNKTINANQYTLTLTKEQMNDTYIKLLETLKQDQIILSKIETIQTQLFPNQENNNDQQQANNTTSLKDSFIENIDKTIEDIKSKNIGNEEIKVSVYESNGQTVKIKIATDTYDLYFNMLNKAYLEINYTVKDEVENSVTIKIDKSENKINFDYIKINDKNENNLNITQERIIDANNQTTQTTLEYRVNENKLTMEYSQKDQIVNNFDNTPEFTNSNSVNMSTLSDDQSAKIQATVNEKLQEKLYNISTLVNYNELLDVLKGLKIINEEIKIDELNKLTNAEISTFNSQFEFYKGQDLDATTVVSLIEISKGHLETAEVITNNQIRLNISRNTQNSELAKKIEDIVQNDTNKGKKYTVSFEYDQESGILTAILINIQAK